MFDQGPYGQSMAVDETLLTLNQSGDEYMLEEDERYSDLSSSEEFNYAVALDDEDELSYMLERTKLQEDKTNSFIDPMRERYTEDRVITLREINPSYISTRVEKPQRQTFKNPFLSTPSGIRRKSKTSGTQRAQTSRRSESLFSDTSTSRRRDFGRKDIFSISRSPSQAPTINIPPSLNFISKLGEGGYGKVLKVQLRSDGKLYALKIFSGERGERNFYRERDAYRALSEYPKCDPHIVCMRGEGEYRGRYFILQELMTGTLVDFIGYPDSKNYKIHDPLALIYTFLQLAEGLKTIHEAGLAHADIKPGNLLYKRGLPNVPGNRLFNNKDLLKHYACFKYGDLGFACTTPPEYTESHSIVPVSRSSACGTREVREIDPFSFLRLTKCEAKGTKTFMEPDYYLYYSQWKRGMPLYPSDDIRYYQANDVWALGLIFRSMIAGYESVLGLHTVVSQDQIKPIIYDSGKPGYQKLGVDNLINNLINNRMVVIDKTKRFTAKYIVDYLNDILNYFESPGQRGIISSDYITIY